MQAKSLAKLRAQILAEEQANEEFEGGGAAEFGAIDYESDNSSLKNDLKNLKFTKEDDFNRSFNEIEEIK
jgi:hypothetical protein